MLLFDTLPDSLGEPLPGSSVSRGSKEDIAELYKDWEDDLQVAIDVCSHHRFCCYSTLNVDVIRILAKRQSGQSATSEVSLIIRMAELHFLATL
jgi:hypothetical protein